MISGLGEVRPLSLGDLPRLAEIHVSAFGTTGTTVDEVRFGYTTRLEQVFLNQPGLDRGSPSLVFVDDGVVVGFVLVFGREVVFRGDPVWLATTSHLLVDPESRASLAAIHLLRAVTDGPQHLTYVDRSNAASRKTLQAAGFVPLPNYSLRWKRTMRPAVLTSQRVATRLGGRADFLVGATSRTENALPSRLRARTKPQLPEVPRTLTREPLTIEHITGAGPGLMAGYDLHPAFHDAALVEREWNLLARARPKSDFVRRALLSPRGEVLGWYVVDIDADAMCEVLQFVARRDQQRAALIAMLHDLDARGVMTVAGDAPMGLLYDLEGLGCRLSSALGSSSVHANDPELVDAFLVGQAWLSGLEGEFTLNPPASVPAGVA